MKTLFPNKKYEKLDALQKKWGMSQDDMFYAIENGMLNACIWLPLCCIERGVIENNKFLYQLRDLKEGFVRVRSEDCRYLCSTGRAKLRTFRSSTEEGIVLRMSYEPPQPAISVRVDDLVVLREEQERFEKAHNITEYIVVDSDEEDEPYFVASEDYRHVKLGDNEYDLGDFQARIVEFLYDALHSHKPWVHGKTLIHESGSSASRFRDLFKNKPDWEKLIISNKRGYYRLNLPLKPKNPNLRREEEMAA